MRKVLLVAAAVVAGVVVACSGGGGPSKCVPGQSVSCTCTDGSAGSQTCSAGGAFNPCVCTTGGGGSGGGGGGGGSTGPACLLATEACASGGTCCNGMECWQANGVTDCLPKEGQSCYTQQYSTATNVVGNNGGVMECCNTKGGTAGTGAYATSCTCNTCGGQNGAQGGCVQSGGPGQTCSPCNVDADCPIGHSCMKPATGTGSCVAACATVGHAPSATLKCCDGLVVDSSNVCLLPSAAPCLSDADCQSHTCNRTATTATCA